MGRQPKAKGSVRRVNSAKRSSSIRSILAALHRTQARLRLVLDAADFGTCDFYPQTGKFVWDDQMKRLWGLAPTEHLTPEQALERVHPADRERVRQAVGDALSPGGPGQYQFEFRMLLPDGTVRWHSAKGRVFFSAGRGSPPRAVRLSGVDRDITPRKHAQRYRSLFEHGLDGIILTSPNGSIEDANPAACGMLGYSVAELCQLRWEQVIDKESGLESSPQPSSSPTSAGRERKLIRKDGTHVPVDLSSVVVGHGRESECTFLIVRNSTERKRAEQALRERAEHQSFLLNLIDTISRLSDSAEIESAALRLLAEELDASRCNLTEYDTSKGYAVVRRDYVRNGGRSGAGVHHMADYPSWGPVLSAGRPFVVSDTHRSPSLRPGEREVLEAFDIRAQITVPLMRNGVLLAGLTVTQSAPRSWTPFHIGLMQAAIGHVWGAIERARALASRSEIDERYRALFNNIGDGVQLLALVRDQDGRVIDTAVSDINPAWEKHAGISGRQLIGRRTSEFFPDTDTEFRQAEIEVEATGVPRRIEAFSTSFGRHIEANYFKLGPGRVGVAFRNITDRKRAEEALRAANEQLLEADRRKNEFLGTLSHELRNPLAAIKNSLHVMNHVDRCSPEATRAQAIIGRQAEQLSRLVEDLLDVTRIARNKVQLRCKKLELNELVQRTLEDYRPSFENAGVGLQMTSASAPVPVFADPNRIAQILGNLLLNAAKFTPPRGLVTVSVSEVRGSQRAVVSVSDTGVGLPSELARRLFEPFVQADSTLARSKGGLGLGLALVKGFVELHGGEVFASSPGPGKGSVFTFQLPLALTQPDVAERREMGLVKKQRRVLIVEDNFDAADSLQEAIRIAGHDVRVAHNGPDGIAQAREFQPDLVFCDIGLPGMDGYEVARLFRADEALRKVHLVALSGYALPEDVQRAADAGFDRHVAKPPSIEKLEGILGSMAGP